MARPTIYPRPGGSVRLNALVSAPTKDALEKARAELAKLSGWLLEDVSDGDALQYALTRKAPPKAK